YNHGSHIDKVRFQVSLSSSSSFFFCDDIIAVHQAKSAMTTNTLARNLRSRALIPLPFLLCIPVWTVSDLFPSERFCFSKSMWN
ncbi:unnamed protein product, partial [Mycena citricolor]